MVPEERLPPKRISSGRSRWCRDRFRQSGKRLTIFALDSERGAYGAAGFDQRDSRACLEGARLTSFDCTAGSREAKGAE